MGARHARERAAKQEKPRAAATVQPAPKNEDGRPLTLELMIEMGMRHVYVCPDCGAFHYSPGATE